MLPTKQFSTKAHPFLIHWLILGLGLLVVGGAIGYAIVHDHNLIDVLEQDRLMTQAKVVDVNVEHDLESINMALGGIINDLPYWKTQKISKALVNRHLKAMSDALPGVRTLLITDAEGTVSACNREQLIGLNFREREFFRTSRQGGNPAMLYISQPFKTALGVFSINMVRVLIDAQGRFTGAVSATMDPEYYNMLLNAVRYTPGMRASLIHGEGKIFVEAPDRKDLVGTDLAKPGSRYTLHKESGREANIFTTGRALTTGDERMSAWRTIQPASLLMDKPLMISVNRDMKGIFASWRSDAFRQSGLFGLLILVAVIGLYLYQRRQQKFDRLEVGYTNEIKESEERFRRLADATWEGIIIQKDGSILDANGSASKMFGYAAEEIVGIKMLDLFAPESMEPALQKLQESIATPKRPQMYLEAVGLRKDRTIFPLEMMGRPIRYNNLDARVIAVRDMTERKHAEELLRENEDQLRMLSENLADGMVYQINSGRDGQQRVFTYLSPAIERLHGLKVEDVKQNPALIYDQVDGNHLALIAEAEAHAYATRSRLDVDVPIRLPSGDLRWRRFISSPRTHSDGSILWDGIELDITERKKLEEVLHKSEQKYRLLVENTSEAIVVVQDGRASFVNRGIEWAGYTPEEYMSIPVMETVHPEDREAAEQRYLKKINGDPTPTRHTYRGLDKGGRIHWIDVSSVLIDWEGRPATLNLILDITDHKLAEEKLQDTLESLRKAVGVTIQVLASAVETRDPYTSGHQIRSANLARTIAMEIGLPQDKIDAIRMAASVHDIGKLSIPAEILSKPTTLSAIELLLIKEHATSGYEMLKDVVSPWPLAEIVRQHHERMDGSGYPRNLKGDDILIEARVLAVADVVEAMASHRPYRPGLGIDAALNEIEKNSGIYYDDSVADACLRLFREKGFKLEGS
jgi:PAS domain S-box-containing protein